MPSRRSARPLPPALPCCWSRPRSPPGCVGPASSAGCATAEVAATAAQADLPLGRGTASDGMATRNWSMPRPGRLLSVNLDAAHLTSGFEADVAVVGDVRAFCEALTLRLRAREPWA